MGINEVRSIETLHSKVFSSLALWKTKSSQYENILLEHKDESDNIEELLTRTLTLGESNSLLVVGPRGCGKTLIINAVLDKLRSKSILELGMVINLTGLLQTDDNLALQEITRQLDVDGDSACKFLSFAENLSFILKALQKGNQKSSKPLIFILDEFDLFCHHKNQTLLYNLFDIAQSAQAPICVVGLTSRLDVIELLEKRVKSRFSHRQLFIYPQAEFEKYLQIAANLLKLQDWDASINQKTALKWNESIDDVLGNPEVKDIFKRRFCISRDTRNLKSFLVIAFSGVSEDSPFLSLSNFKEAVSCLSLDAKLKILQSLSTLQLSLVIAMKHLNEVYDEEPFNFEMVFRQYNKLGEKHSSMSSYERPVVFKAFNQLECLELIQSMDQNKSLQREYRLMQLQVSPRQIDEAVHTTPNLPTFIKHWNATNV